MAARNSTPDMFGEQVVETSVAAVLGYDPSPVVRAYRWDGYAGMDEGTAAFVRAKTDQVHDGEDGAGRGIVKMGQALIEVKQKLGHGKWGSWVTAEFAWGQRQAENFMNVALAFSELPAGSRLSPSALGMLASPGVPAEVREQVVGRSMTEQVSIIETREMIAAAKREQEAEAARRQMAVDVVMTWYTKGLTEKQRKEGEALRNAETPRWWKTLKPYALEADLDDGEVKAALRFVRANIRTLASEWGEEMTERQAAKAAGQGKSGMPPAARPKEKAPERRPTGTWPEVEQRDEEEEERRPRVSDQWIEVNVVEQEVLREVLRLDVVVTDAGELVIPVVGGYVTFGAVLSGRDAVMMWRLDRA